MRASIALAALIATLALACGSGDSVSDRDVSAAPESASATAARPTPTSPAAPSPIAPIPITPIPAAPSGADADVVSECRALAEKQEWESALEPCTRAAAQLPDDLGIRHALQQAQAAAADTARSALGAVPGDG